MSTAGKRVELRRFVRPTDDLSGCFRAVRRGAHGRIASCIMHTRYRSDAQTYGRSSKGPTQMQRCGAPLKTFRAEGQKPTVTSSDALLMAPNYAEVWSVVLRYRIALGRSRPAAMGAR